jgi:hypothetical protein
VEGPTINELKKRRLASATPSESAAFDDAYAVGFGRHLNAAANSAWTSFRCTGHRAYRRVVNRDWSGLPTARALEQFQRRRGDPLHVSRNGRTRLARDPAGFFPVTHCQLGHVSCEPPPDDRDRARKLPTVV